MNLFVLSLLLFSLQLQPFHCHHGRSIPNSRLNFFDIELLRYAAEDKHTNVMVSPASAKISLAMLLEGARDSTANEIRRTLRLSANPDDRKMELFTYLDAVKPKASVLESANGIFVSKKLLLKKEYETNVKQDFGAEIHKVDFEDSRKSVDLINSWVKEKTFGTIPSILETASLPTTSQIIIANALYFKSSWKFAFDPQRTKPDCFHRYGVCQKVAMMELEKELPYGYINDLRAHAVELPYETSRYSMVLLVPLEHDGCEALIRDLPFISLAQIHDKMHLTDVTLSMPKFTVDFTVDMVETLQKMRINTLFSNKANLTGIFDSPGQVSSFQHKVFMSIDEVGTIASAVSSAAVVPLSFSGVEIKVDRPFVFLIRDNVQGIVLFEGKIEEPTAFEEKTKIVPARTSTVNPVVTTLIVDPKPLAKQRPIEVLTPIFFPRNNFPTVTETTTTTTENSGGFFSSVKDFFG